MSKGIPHSQSETICTRCNRKYLDRFGLCPQCDDTTSALSAGGEVPSAYGGARVVLGLLLVIGLLGGLGLIGFGITGREEPDVMFIVGGVVVLLTATLQNLLGNAFLDLVDAAVQANAKLDGMRKR